MAFKTAVWSVNGSLLQAHERMTLDSERRLEDWIAHDLSLLGEELMLIGRQVRTTGGPLDLLAMDVEGTLVIAELKRDRTPREVIAQVLDYASWVRERDVRDIDGICLSTTGKSLPEAFRARFESDLPENACKSHRMLIVAAELDDSSERIIHYLQKEHEIDINAVFFSVYQVGEKEVLARAWLADPVETQQRAERRERAPWSGVWFVNNGIDETDNGRDWELCRAHGFLSAGGDERYWRPLYKLELGDTIAVYQKGHGYVGIGTVTRAAVPADEFTLANGSPLNAISRLKGARGQQRAEHVIGVEWVVTKPTSEAKTFRGVFANQNVVCKLRHTETLDFLRQEFDVPLGASNA